MLKKEDPSKDGGGIHTPPLGEVNPSKREATEREKEGHMEIHAPSLGEVT